MNYGMVSLAREESTSNSATSSSSQESEKIIQLTTKRIYKCGSDCLQSITGAYYADPSLIIQKLLCGIICEGTLPQETPEADLKTEATESSIPLTMMKKIKSILRQRFNASRSKRNTVVDKDVSEICTVNARGNMLHRPYRSKDVPLRVFVKGVRCYLCFCLYKGVTCVEKLIQHTLNSHKDTATPALIAKLRENTAFENVIGEGIYYCTCNFCLHFGRARCDKSLARGPFSQSGMEVKHSP